MKKRLIKKIGIIFYILIMFTLLVHALTFITNFNEGIYVNTEYNGSAVILIGENLTGDYTSNVFDAGENVTWDKLSWQGEISIVGEIYAVDGNSDIWKSIDLGVTWNLVKDDYNGAETDGANTMTYDGYYFYIIEKQKTWRNNNVEGTWTKVNDDFNGGVGANALFIVSVENSLFIIDGAEDVYKSADNGTTWIQIKDNLNGASGDIRGFAIDSFNNFWVADGSADVWKSNDLGITWILIKDDYNGGEGNANAGFIIDDSDYLYIIDNDDDVWKSIDFGATWNKVNDDYNGEGQHAKNVFYFNDYLYIIEADEDIWASNDEGVTWNKQIVNFNEGNGDVKGTARVNKGGDLIFQVRNCSFVNCSDAQFAQRNLNNLNLISRYFQYKVYFERDNASSSLELYDVSINYSIMNTAPITTLESPINNYDFSVQEITFVCSAFDNEELSNITLYGSWSEGWHANETKSLTGTSNSTTFTKTISNGTYTWNCLVYDSGGLNDWANNFTFTISEGYAPGEGGFEDGALVGESEKKDEFLIDYLTKKELTKQIIIISIILFVFVSLVILLIYLTFKLSK